MQPLTSITAAILAGGLGTRLRSVVSDRSKVMAMVGDRPFLTFLLDQVAATGIQHVVLCTGYKGDQVQETLGNEWKGMQLSYSQESSPLGTGGAIRLALPHFQSDTVLVMNGDSYFGADLTQSWEWHCTKGAAATLLLKQVPDTRRYGRVQVDEAGQVLKFEEKGNTEGAGWINAGIYWIGRSLLTQIPPDRAVSIEQELFPQWIGQGLYGCYGDGKFLDIGLPETYAIAQTFFADVS